MTKLLFICSQNKLRSPTAEQVFSSWPDVETDSAGLDDSAIQILGVDQIEWAELIFVMEKSHKSKLNKKYRPHLNGKKIICLDIPDEYEFMDPTLIKLLKSKVPRHLPAR